jgi:hypothetical protein
VIPCTPCFCAQPYDSCCCLVPRIPALDQAFGRMHANSICCRQAQALGTTSGIQSPRPSARSGTCMHAAYAAGRPNGIHSSRQNSEASHLAGKPFAFVLPARCLLHSWACIDRPLMLGRHGNQLMLQVLPLRQLSSANSECRHAGSDQAPNEACGFSPVWDTTE